jgi:hypothetical protein
MDKVFNMPITILKDKQESEELKNFKAEMLQAIKETEIALKIRAENEKRDRENLERQAKSMLEQVKGAIFGCIELKMNEKGLKIQDLGEYANYQEQINNLDKICEMDNLRDKVLDHVFSLPKRDNPNPETPEQPDNPKKDQKSENDKVDKVLQGFRTHKYDNLSEKELIKEIEKEKLNNSSLQKLVSQLEIKVEELQEEIRELKAELPQTKKTREEIQKRETQLQQVQSALNTLTHNNNNNNNP